METKMISEHSEEEFNDRLSLCIKAGWEVSGELQIKSSSSSVWNSNYNYSDHSHNVVYAIMLKRYRGMSDGYK